MEPERRKQILLAVLAAVLLVVAIRAWTTQSSPPRPSSNGQAGQTPAARRGKSAPVGAPDVHLKALHVERSRPMEALRNVFRFKPKPPPPPPPPAPRIQAPPSTITVPTGPPPPPPLPPIALKFIGLVQTADKTQRLAVLSDGRGGIPIYGKEGDIIEGRYRIVKIGTESIELTYLDGRGRQTIRLSGV
jgi:hypothetical protein